MVCCSIFYSHPGLPLILTLTRLRIHPTQEWFDIYQPFANDDLQRFLDHFLLVKDNGWQYTPRVRLSLLRYNQPPISFRVEDAYPPSRVKYQKFWLEAANRRLTSNQPNQEGQVSYQSDSWDDNGAHFNLTFDQPTELIGSSQAVLYMSCQDLDDMDVYIILRKLDKDGNALLHHNIPFEHQAAGVTREDIPDVNIYKYVGPSGRLRASKRAIAEEPDIAENRRGNREPTELFFPHDKEEKVPPGQVVELRIPIWPGGIAFEAGESLRLEIKGHDPILPEYPPLHRSLRNLNRGRHAVHTGGGFSSHLIVPLARA